jgi:diguanylate cyclase (GGDEF)-like protein
MLNSWRWYSFSREQYNECMSKIFINNLNALRQASNLAAILAGVFSLFPLIFERNLFKTAAYLVTALIAFLLGLYINYKMQRELVKNRFIYVFTTIYFTNIILFGIVLGVWLSPDNFAVTYMCILICALSLFINPPHFNLCLTLGAIILFSAATVIIKPSQFWVMDISNALFAGFISLFLNWEISKLRLGLELSANMLEDERNQYFDQSTIDELTKLRNRRDFMQTFQRYLSGYRTSDVWLCISITDIDFFKNYNDHYGHPKGDDCLRGVGGVFNNLTEVMGVYSARVGVEEFALLWFEKDASHVDAVITYMMEKMGALKIPHEKSKVAPYVTLSIGVYIERCGASTDMQTLYDLADQSLYAAKTNGRNCAFVKGRDIVQYKVTPPA